MDKYYENGIRMVVVGDSGTGKTSLILTVLMDDIPTTGNIPSVLPPSRLPVDGVPITIIDTSSSIEQKCEVEEELKRADVVMLTYAYDSHETIDRLTTHWLPQLSRLEVTVPIIIVGCKLDLKVHEQQLEEVVLRPMMQQFQQIEFCTECSAYEKINILDVFCHAQKAVLHPTTPLFDQEMQTLRRECLSALKRLFFLCDRDKDGALNEVELNEFQVKCFKTSLQPSEIVGVKRVVQDRLPEGVNEHGLTLQGFMFLHALFIEKGRTEMVWTVLRKFGYDNNIRLGGDFLPPSFERAPDQSVELSNDAIDYLKGVFSMNDNDKDGALQPKEMDDLFSTAPDCPWSEGPYQDAAPTTASGGMTLDGFLSKWALMTLREPAKSVEYLKYVMYDGDVSSTIRLTRRRRTDRKNRQSERNVYQCFVFGLKKAGKSALLDAFLERTFSPTCKGDFQERYAVNVVEEPLGGKKFLVLREIPEEQVKKLLSDKQSLAACDVAVFVYDSSDELSWKKAAELIVEIAGHGEDTGCEVPSLIVAAKDDLIKHPIAVHDSARTCQDMVIEAPVSFSAKSGDFNSIFRRIVKAAEHPHLNIPETEAGRNRKQYHHFVSCSLMFVSVAVVGLAAYRVYAARRNSSS